MPSVVVWEDVHAPREEVYRLAKNVPAIADYAEPVRSIRVVEEGPGYLVTAWEVLFQGRLLRWTERDEFDDESCTIRYRQISGDLAKFEGDWTFTETDGVTRVTLRVDFDLGIPMLAALLNPVATALTRRSSEAIVRAVRRQAEAAAR